MHVNPPQLGAIIEDAHAEGYLDVAFALEPDDLRGGGSTSLEMFFFRIHVAQNLLHAEQWIMHITIVSYVVKGTLFVLKRDG